ncbi:hypothetical protein GBF38_006521 [Nibea albiflora]|uniref:Uncharacterized protein n=1 Tax=Nibea albiflora TaxID=240163 RepID=A0ACB7EGA1_NIBAL|nr:hypothetical protein GBF38_006521 [Nibea albiflora]
MANSPVPGGPVPGGPPPPLGLGLRPLLDSPMVEMKVVLKASSLNRNSRQVLPTAAVTDQQQLEQIVVRLRHFPAVCPGDFTDPPAASTDTHSRLHSAGRWAYWEHWTGQHRHSTDREPETASSSTRCTAHIR